MERSWSSTGAIHAFQGRTVENVIAAMEATHPHLTTQKKLGEEMGPAKDSAELVTDDRDALRQQLEVANGERIAALKVVGPGREHSPARDKDMDRGAGRIGERLAVETPISSVERGLSREAPELEL